MNITYHIVPKSYYESQKRKSLYAPAEFGKDGFIHCTDGEYALSVIAFNIYRKLKDELLILFINKDKVTANIRYEDEDKIFPHIYGQLNWDAIVKTSKMVKDQKGDWIFPIQEVRACAVLRSYKYVVSILHRHGSPIAIGFFGLFVSVISLWMAWRIYTHDFNLKRVEAIQLALSGKTTCQELKQSNCQSDHYPVDSIIQLMIDRQVYPLEWDNWRHMQRNAFEAILTYGSSTSKKYVNQLADAFLAAVYFANSDGVIEWSDYCLRGMENLPNGCKELCASSINKIAFNKYITEGKSSKSLEYPTHGEFAKKDDNAKLAHKLAACFNKAIASDSGKLVNELRKELSQ